MGVQTRMYLLKLGTNRTRMWSVVDELVDAFARKYGLSKSAVVSLSVLYALPILDDLLSDGYLYNLTVEDVHRKVERLRKYLGLGDNND